MARGRRIGGAAAAVDYLAPGLTALANEALCVVHLDADRRILGVRRRYSRMCDSVGLPLRLIVADALALGSHGLILGHNHPSGDPTPSRADLTTTRMLADMAAALDLRLHDHLVFGDGEHRSFRAMGYL